MFLVFILVKIYIYLKITYFKLRIIPEDLILKFKFKNTAFILFLLPNFSYEIIWI